MIYHIPLYDNTTAYSLQIVFVNRLVLNLSNAANTQEDANFRLQTGLEPPLFATGSILGNIGGPVRTSLDDFEDEYLGSDDVEGVRRNTDQSYSLGANQRGKNMSDVKVGNS